MIDNHWKVISRPLSMEPDTLSAAQKTDRAENKSEEISEDMKVKSWSPPLIIQIFNF